MNIFTSKERIQSIFCIVVAAMIGAYFLFSNSYETSTGVIDSQKNVPTLVIDALKHNHATYLANVWATMGFLILAIGWIISSEKAREFFSNSNSSRRVCLNSIAILMVFHSIILFDMVYESERVLSNIDIPGAQYFVISMNHAISSVIVDGVFFVLLWTLIEQQAPKDNNA